MSVQSLNDIWEQVCEECKKTITQVAFDTFFVELCPISVDSEYMTLVAKNIYIKDMMDGIYKELLTNSIKSVLGLDIKPYVILEEDKEQVMSAEELNAGLTFEDFFTFENFVVGSTNRFAQAAAYSVSTNPEITYNPLVIYGPPGVGKTHLLLAIKNQIKKSFPYKKIEYTRCEDFANQLISALQKGKLGMGTPEDFRNKYRNADVLLIDDIQFIAGKEQTQEEFFNTFNTLYQSNKQIVVTLDRAPKDVKTLDSRIRSRLEAGLFADILSPDFETRVGIIKAKTNQMGIDLGDNLVYYVAENIKANTRQLEGVVKKLQAFVEIQKRTPDLSVVQSMIRDVINDTKPEPVKIEKIISEVARTYNVSELDILSNRKTSSLALARQVAMYIARETTDLSYKAIGESFGRDHTTVLYNVNKIEQFLQDKPYEKALVDDLIKNLKGEI